ncbi:hypothetical protein [Algihabitans albus]|uniref:hypothetical protein n=1 Tax=Algihabitans albus TaxID=2164067 RepID=UPI000E5CCA4E|nr:hypothetical protein [Algihabitans albus]
MAALTPDDALALTQSCLERVRGRRRRREWQAEVARLQAERKLPELRRLADEADAEEAAAPGWRRDIDG